MCPAQLCALPGAVSRGSAAAGGAAANIPAIIAPAANHTLVCVIFRYPCPGSAPSILPLAGSKANTGMSLRRSLRAAPSHFCEPSSIIEFLFDTLGKCPPRINFSTVRYVARLGVTPPSGATLAESIAELRHWPMAETASRWVLGIPGRDRTAGRSLVLGEECGDREVAKKPAEARQRPAALAGRVQRQRSGGQWRLGLSGGGYSSVIIPGCRKQRPASRRSRASVTTGTPC
jgi:hypothetical protein